MKRKPQINKSQLLISWIFVFGGKTRLACGFAWIYVLLLRLVSLSSAPSSSFRSYLPCHSFCFTVPRFLLPWNHVLFLIAISLMQEPSHSGQLEHFPGRMLLRCQKGHFFLLPPKQFRFNSLYLLWILKKWWIDLSINIYQEFTLFVLSWECKSRGFQIWTLGP